MPHIDDRNKLIHMLKSLIARNNKKQQEYQEQNKLTPDVGCLTRELVTIASLLPQMIILNIRLDEVNQIEAAEENGVVAYSIPFQRIPETHVNVCLCKEPEKSWTCKKCGKFGGCDNQLWQTLQK